MFLKNGSNLMKDKSERKKKTKKKRNKW